MQDRRNKMDKLYEHIFGKGLTYVPRFVKQVSDMEYGSVVTHENYNEKLNLNTTQGDYNTEVLRILFTESNPDKVTHIPYLDKHIDEQVDRLDTRIDKAEERIQENADNIQKNADEISRFHEAVENIINGPTVVYRSKTAEMVLGADEAGVRKYYGTDFSAKVGFHDIPPALFAEDIDGKSAEVEGVYIKMRPNSITEEMCDDNVRAKLNRANLTDYEELENLPKINGITLIKNRTLQDLGIQAAGTYITPSDLASQLLNYVTTSSLNATLNNYATTSYVQNNYVSNTTLNGKGYATTSQAQSYANTAQSNAINQSNRVWINSVSGTPRYGDLLITT